MSALWLSGCNKATGPMRSDGRYCVALSPGEAQPVANFDSGLWGLYRLARLPSQDGRPSYEAKLALEFVADDPGVGADALARYREKVSACFEQIKPYLTGPNGEQLSLKLAGSNVAEESRIEIRVSSRAVRGHWKLWREDWGCPEILHEVFHQFGLVDEYAEPQLAQYDCRAVGPDTSLMSFPELAYDEVTNGRRRSLLFPAEFNAVVHPGCAESQTYYRCAQEAYLTSVDKGGKGCGEERPAACSRGALDWLN